jgi:hypothetical protein
MTQYRFRCLIAACLTLAAGLGAGLSASPAPRPAGNVDILVGGAPQPRYRHGGRWYVEALKGREYAIRLHNPYDVRVAVALSVDGLNTIDARETTATGARKWVLGPHETVTISGWQTSRREARRFEFTTEARSYGQALGKTSNLGLISAVFFKERVSARILNEVPSGHDSSRRQAAPPASAAGSAAPAPAEQELGAASSKAEARSRDEYAATGMGRQTDHHVTQVWLDLEDSPAQSVDIRYEFRPQLVSLGILPPARTADPLDRRERARGFEPGFSPDPHGHR